MVFSLSSDWEEWGLWKLPDGRDWLRRKLGLVLTAGPLLSKSLIQFSVDGQGCVSSLLFDLRPNDGRGNEDNDDLLQKVPCHTQHPLPCSRPPPTHTSTGDSWTLMGKSGSVSCRVTAPFCWVLGMHKVLFVPFKSLFPQSCVNSGISIVGLIVTSSKRAYAIPMSAAPRAPPPAAGHSWSIPLQGTLKHSTIDRKLLDPTKKWYPSSKGKGETLARW